MDDLVVVLDLHEGVEEVDPARPPRARQTDELLIGSPQRHRGPLQRHPLVTPEGHLKDGAVQHVPPTARTTHPS